MTDERLREIVGSKRTLLHVAYGYLPETLKVQYLSGGEIEEMVSELLALRQAREDVSSGRINV